MWLTGTLLFLGLLAGAGWLWSVWNGKKPVDGRQLQMYSRTYLKTYNRLVERAALPKYRKEFTDYAHAPFAIDATISNDHGAAIQLIPSEEESFQCRTVADGIDRAVFARRGPLTPSVEPDSNSVGDHGYPTVDRVFRISEQDIVLTRLRVRDILVLKTGSVMTKEMIIQDTPYLNTTIVKGDSQRSHWGLEIARADAQRSFRLDLIGACLFSQEFREFIATPELTHIAQDMVSKRNKGVYTGKYGYIQFRDDLETLVAKANIYGTSAEFAKCLYDFEEKQKSWFERHLVLSGLLVSAIGAIIVCSLRWVYRKFLAMRIVGQASSGMKASP